MWRRTGKVNQGERARADECFARAGSPQTYPTSKLGSLTQNSSASSGGGAYSTSSPSASTRPRGTSPGGADRPSSGTTPSILRERERERERERDRERERERERDREMERERVREREHQKHSREERERDRDNFAAARGNKEDDSRGGGDAFDPESVAKDLKKEGSDWMTMFNPNVKRVLDVGLVHTLVHDS